MPVPSIDDPDLTLSDLFDHWPDAIGVFLAHRMLCVGCLISPFHTISDACQEYGLDESAFRAEIRSKIRKTPSGSGPGSGASRFWRDRFSFGRAAQQDKPMGVGHDDVASCAFDDPLFFPSA